MHPRHTPLTTWECAALQNYMNCCIDNDSALLAAWIPLNSLMCLTIRGAQCLISSSLNAVRSSYETCAYETANPCLETRLYALFAE